MSFLVLGAIVGVILAGVAAYWALLGYIALVEWINPKIPEWFPPVLCGVLLVLLTWRWWLVL